MSVIFGKIWHGLWSVIHLDVNFKVSVVKWICNYSLP